MSQFTYTKKPNFLGDGARNMSPTNPTIGTQLFPTSKGWVAPMAGMNYAIGTAISWTTGVAMVTATAHGLVTGQSALIVNATPAGYNGYFPITVVDANTFTYPLTSNPGTALVAVTNTAIAWSNGIATVTATAHSLNTNGEVTIAGATPAGYNATGEITVVDANTFTYKVATNPGTATVFGTSTPSASVFKSVEVIVALRQLDVINADALVVPTFTAAFTYSALAHAVTGNTLTVTVTPSEPVAVSGAPVVALTIGANTRSMTYVPASSTSTSLVFTYTVIAGDVATTTQVTTAAAITGTTTFGDILINGSVQPIASSALTFTAPVTSTISVN
jgi:hypothetical protein